MRLNKAEKAGRGTLVRPTPPPRWRPRSRPWPRLLFSSGLWGGVMLCGGAALGAVGCLVALLASPHVTTKNVSRPRTNALTQGRKPSLNCGGETGAGCSGPGQPGGGRPVGVTQAAPPGAAGHTYERTSVRRPPCTRPQLSCKGADAWATTPPSASIPPCRQGATPPSMGR